MRKKHPLITAIVSATLLTACSGSNGGSGTVGLDRTETNEVKNNAQVYFDQTAAIPLTKYNVAPNYLFHLNNPTAEDYTLTSFSVTDTTGKVDLSKLVSVATSGNNIPANGSIDFNFTVHAKKSADVLIKAQVKNSKGEARSVVHLLRLTTQVSGKGIIGVNDIDKVVTSSGDFGLMVPVVLTHDYDKIKAANGNLVCNTPAYTVKRGFKMYHKSQILPYKLLTARS